MNVPIIVVIAWSFAIGVLLMSWFYRGLRIIDLEGKLAEWEGDDDDGASLRSMVESGLFAPTSMTVSEFSVASRADIFDPPPGGMPSRMMGWEGGYRNASGHMQPFPPDAS